MKAMLERLDLPGSTHRGAALALCTGSMLICFSLAPRAMAGTAGTTAPTTPPVVKPVVSATLEQCVTAVDQDERAATFAGEMAAIPGSSKMEMRIDVLERMPKETLFHTVVAPGLGVWRTAAPGVKTYRYLKEVTNLAAPAYYRAAVRFRWLNAHGKLIKALELRTPRCQQPAAPAEAGKPVEEVPPPA
jgi:hypothetical protein